MSARTRCQAHLDILRREHQGVVGTLLSTMDGFEVAASAGGDISPNKLAAMASSLLALAEAVSREGAVGQCRDLVIESSAGLVLLMDVPSTTHRAVLTVLCTEAALLGRIRWAARNAREAIAQALVKQKMKIMRALILRIAVAKHVGALV